MAQGLREESLHETQGSESLHGCSSPIEARKDERWMSHALKVDHDTIPRCAPSQRSK